MEASTTIQRRVQWTDTDAAGIWHYSVVIRWAEEAEAELYRSLGIINVAFGATPRVKVDFDFHRSIRFDDVVDITLTVTALGKTSVTYDIAITSESTPVASGRIVAVFIDRESGEKKEWPSSVREALSGPTSPVDAGRA